MFKLNKKAYEGNATTELVANVVKELGKMFDVLSKVILQNKYDANEHIKVLAEINTLLDIANETQVKINVLKKQLVKIDKQKKDEDEIPF